jgi:hypothetical protein
MLTTTTSTWSNFLLPQIKLLPMIAADDNSTFCLNTCLVLSDEKRGIYVPKSAELQRRQRGAPTFWETLDLVKVELECRNWNLVTSYCQWTYALNKFLALCFGESKMSIVGLSNWPTDYDLELYLNNLGRMRLPRQIPIRCTLQPPKQKHHCFDVRTQCIPGLHPTSSQDYLYWAVTDFLIFEVEHRFRDDMEQATFCVQLVLTENDYQLINPSILFGRDAVEITRTKESIVYALAWENKDLYSGEDFLNAYREAFQWCQARLEQPDVWEPRPFGVFYLEQRAQKKTQTFWIDFEQYNVSPDFGCEPHCLGQARYSVENKTYVDLPTFFGC